MLLINYKYTCTSHWRLAIKLRQKSWKIASGIRWLMSKFIRHGEWLRKFVGIKNIYVLFHLFFPFTWLLLLFLDFALLFEPAQPCLRLQPMLQYTCSHMYAVEYKHYSVLVRLSQTYTCGMNLNIIVTHNKN